MNNKRAPTPTDIPMNDLGDDDTMMFHVAVIVIERPDAIMAKSVDTANSVELNISNPIDPMRLIMAPMMIGLSFPIRFMINGVTAAKTRNIIMKGSCTFAASTASPPNPKGTGLLTNCTIAGYAMNIVIPLTINMMYEGRRVLSFSNLRSTNGDAIFLSMMTKTDNEIIETINAAPICGKVSEFIPVSRSVSAMRKAIIVVESASAPFKSMEGDACFLPVLS